MSISSRRLVPAVLLFAGSLVALAAPAAAQHRARLSRDLDARLARGAASMDVILRGTREEIDALARRHAVRVRRYLKAGAVLRLNAGQLEALSGDQAVDRISSDAPVRASGDVTRETIGADQVWAGAGLVRPLSGAGVGVAVIDSGVDPSHRALAGRVVASVDFTGGDGIDRYGHGTHVASLIAGAAGRTADTADYQGIAPGARIVSLRVLDEAGAGQASDVIEAIDWAIDNRARYGIRVINLSLGAPVTQSWRDDPLCEAAQRAVDAGLIVVAAAGNFGITPDGKRIFGGITAPGNTPSVITVGALDTRGTSVRSDDTIAKFSSRGPTLVDHVIKPDLVAPGRNVVAAEAAGSTLAARYPERHVAGAGAEGYMSLSGSSMSAGVVSGTVALLLQGRPALRPAEVRIALQLTSEFMPAEGLVAAGAGSTNALAVNMLGRPYEFGPVTFIAGEQTRPSGLATDSMGGAIRRLLLPSPRTLQAGTLMSSTIVWGSSNDTIVWGSAAYLDTIVWGSSFETIVWGSSGATDTIVWGSGSLDKLIWGSVNAGTIVWGSLTTGETIVWGSTRSDTIVWGSRSSDTIVWGSDGSDTIIWGSAATIVWGSGLVHGDTIVWGSVDGDTIVWGSGVLD
ncbi:MAG: S8 family peptidase [Vicinamibacterales bacterium]